MRSGPQRLKTLARSALPNRAVRLLHKQRVALQVRRYKPWVREGSYGGHFLKVRIADPLSEGWYGHDWPVLSEIALLRELGALRSGACVYDLGAHQGVVALILGREVGPEGFVLAVEAEPHNARVAQINMRENGGSNVTVLHAAISERDGTTRFAESLNGAVSDSQTGTIEVATVTLDTLSLNHRPPDLVFMDIEGYEGRALPAAVETLGSRAAFFVEVHVETLVGTTAQSLVALFGDRDIHIAADPTGDHADFVRYAGGPLPDRRFFLIVV